MNVEIPIKLEIENQDNTEDAGKENTEETGKENIEKTGEMDKVEGNNKIVKGGKRTNLFGSEDDGSVDDLIDSILRL